MRICLICVKICLYDHALQSIYTYLSVCLSIMIIFSMILLGCFYFIIKSFATYGCFHPCLYIYYSIFFFIFQYMQERFRDRFDEYHYCAEIDQIKVNYWEATLQYMKICWIVLQWIDWYWHSLVSRYEFLIFNKT